MQFFTKATIVFFFCYLTNAHSATTRPKSFHHLTVDRGLSHMWIMDILKDQNGFMWFATANGLNKYDGYTFEVYQHSHIDSTSLTQSMVSDIFEDSHGIIWIATGDGLNRYNREQNNFKNYLPSSQTGSFLGRIVQTIIEDKKGNLWISTTEGLNLYDREADKFTHFKYDSLRLERIAPVSLLGDMLEDHNGNLWIGTLERGLIKFEVAASTFTQFLFRESDDPVRSNNSVPALALADNLQLWVGTLGNGLLKYDLNAGAETVIAQYRHDTKNPESLSNNNIMALELPPDGRLWVGTENGGLDLFNPGTGQFTHHVPDGSNPASLNNASVYSIFADSSKNLWVGTYAGGVNVCFSTLQGIKIFRGTPGSTHSLSNNSVTSFLEDDIGNLWIGTDGGGLNYLERSTGKFHVYSTKNSSLNMDAVLSISRDLHGELWISTWEGGISRFDKGKGTFHSFTTKNGLPDNNVITFLHDSKGRFWVGCFFSGLVLFDQTYGRHKLYDHNNSGLHNESIRLLYEDREGKIIIGTDAGFLIFEPETENFALYTEANTRPGGLSSNGVFAIAEENNGILWLGTIYGLNRFDRTIKSFAHYFKEDGLPGNMIVGLEFDEHGFLWISTDRGLARMNPDTQKFKAYSISDGLQGNQFNIHSHYRTRNGEILFGGVNGFNLFHPDSLKENRGIPPIVLTDFQIFNKKAVIGYDQPLQQHITMTKRIDLSYRQSVFSFGFSALSFDAPEKNQYAYKMDGFDQEWVFCGNRREATYTNLPAGDYTFRVIAANNDNVWNKIGTSVQIVIHPPYWQTTWFRLLVILFIAASGATFHMIRLNKEKSRTRELERRVQERTAKLEAANKELEAFAYSISHDLRTPLRGINGFAGVIEEDFGDTLNEEGRGYLKKIRTASARMGQLIDSLLNLSRIMRAELETEHVDLSKLAQEIADELQVLNPNRKVEFKIQPDLYASGDHKLLRVVLENLFQNAWKFTGQKTDARIEFGCSMNGTTRTYFVRDNGVGFDMNFANKLFRPFHRLHREDEFEGTGIGLASVKRIVQRHGGEIWAESSTDQGATFCFKLE